MGLINKIAFFSLVIFSLLMNSQIKASLSPSYNDNEHKKLERLFVGNDKGLVTYQDVMIWLGAGSPCDFSLKELSEKQKEAFEVLGVAEAEKSAYDGNAMSMSILANYYYCFAKCYRKAVYWAEQAAEHGNCYGMNVLMAAYVDGNGVIEDHVEATKWLIIGSATGYEELKEKESIIRQSNPSIYISAKERAKIWMENHRGLFISPK